MLEVDRNFQGASLCQGLMRDGFQVQKFGQTFQDFAAPTLEFINLINTGRLHHGDNPLMKWQMSHLQGDENADGILKPHKARSGDKIDGVVACIMAVGHAMKSGPPQKSWFDTHDELPFIEF